MKLFEVDVVPGPDAVDFIRTPSWLAYELVVRANPSRSDIVCEPTCGDGAVLAQIPGAVRAFGIERDAVLAAEAARATGRHVLHGDALTIALPEIPTVVIGNPPYRQRFLEALLQRLHRDGSADLRLVLLLSSKLFQTSATVVRYANLFSLAIEMVPRDVFPGLEHPLVIATMRKGRKSRIVGIAFAREIAALRSFPPAYRAIMARAQTNVWVDAISKALHTLDRPATIDEIVREIAGNEPTETRFPRQAIRKWLRTAPFENPAPATYALPGWAA